MKKTFLITICFVAFLVACNSAQTEKHVHEEVQHTPIDIYDADVDLMSLAPEDAWINDKETQETEAPIVDYGFYSKEYDSVENMLSGFERYVKIGEREIDYSKALDEETEEFLVLASVADKISENGMVIPKFKGGELITVNHEKTPGLRIKTSSQHGFPQIWYYPIDGIITLSFMSEELIDKVGDGGIKSLMTILYPTVFKKDSIVNTESVMNFGGENIPVIITKYETNDRLHVRFIIENDTYVCIQLYSSITSVYDSVLLENLSFERVKVPKYTGEYMEEIRRRCDW